MKERIKELERQLSDKEQTKSTEKVQPKNVTVVPSSGRDHLEANNQTSRDNREMEIDDILQIISTTMATLKSFESRYKKQGGTSTTPSGM